MKKSNIFQILSETCNIEESVLDEVRVFKKQQHISLHEAFLKKKIITETQLLETYRTLYNLPFFPDLDFPEMTLGFTEKIPIQFLRKNSMVPILLPGNSDRQQRSLIAVNDPSSLQMIDELIGLLHLDTYELVFSTHDSIHGIINLAYDQNRDSAQQLVDNIEENSSEIISEIEETADLLDDTSEAPIIKLVNHIISQSIKARASDIHIEPYQNMFKIRYRVDGTLYDLLTPPKWIQPALISRIKVMARLNIAEKRLPQDGRIEVKIGQSDIDIRVSTIPTTFGERVVLRLLNKSTSLLSIAELGFSKAHFETVQRLIRIPNGIILVTGPTGSGKTTTLYAVLSEINSPDINIITIEDPVEYQIQGIGQIQVNPKIDLTFARGLRSIVRQDPDVILVGEIRDQETAEIAVQSALTGHLVFSTLHTNDSVTAITRLVDIGIEPFLISSAVRAVVAQRLIRTLCNECKISYDADDMTMSTIEYHPELFLDTVLYRANGCENCFNTGYKGRMSIFEILEIDTDIQKLIMMTHDSNQVKQMAMEKNMITLRYAGIQKVLAGITSIAEVLRLTQK
ncbi:MAG: type II secretion system ATPase GspE [Desulfobacterales bacterium]|nr:type II secretion system ATPase GspE [Desulfobacterales bacterium]